jgi:hypothetical protein
MNKEEIEIQGNCEIGAMAYLEGIYGELSDEDFYEPDVTNAYNAFKAGYEHFAQIASDLIEKEREKFSVISPVLKDQIRDRINDILMERNGSYHGSGSILQYIYDLVDKMQWDLDCKQLTVNKEISLSNKLVAENAKLKDELERVKGSDRIGNVKLWDMAKIIVQKLKAANESPLKDNDWNMLEEDWFDWLDEEINTSNSVDLPTSPNQ